jgi:F-type H+-transporting ATPase subunit a
MNELFTFLGLISHNHTFIIIAHTLLTAAIVVGLAYFATKKFQVVPGTAQNLMEAYLDGVKFMGKDVVGDALTKKYLPLIATLGLFIFVANVIGIVPGFESPTSSINFTLALALIVFIYYNFEGIKENGVVKYFKHFLGPVWWLYWLMFPIEIVSHLSRIISLSFRLFGNIKGDDLFLAVILMLAPWVAPMVPFALLTFMALLQAFIFMMLTYVYLAGAVLISDDH